jgi:predicted lipoprotein with Yx(FWY)xxD motif
MKSDLSQKEEKRGWRRLFMWAIPLALVLGIVLLFAPSLMNQVTNQEERGMDEIVGQEPPEEGKQALGPTTVQVKTADPYGQFLADKSGHPLYLFKADQRGGSGQPADSSCYDDCAKSWPPLLSSGEPKAGMPVQTGLLGTMRRKDGSTQVTYNGWPLYRYVKDVGPEAVTGHDVEDFGQEWYLVAPSGDEVHSRGG